jgi:formylglycine-generating enzyme required for sulfatase activity
VENSRLWPWGDSPPSKDKANLVIPPAPGGELYKPEGTLPVGSLVAGAISEGEGIFDLVGNVWEWTSTQQEDGAYIQRGGGFDAIMERITIVRPSIKDGPDWAVGFRCAQ